MGDSGTSAGANDAVAAITDSSPAVSTRAWLGHGLLFLATFFTTTSFGSALVESFSGGRALDADVLLRSYSHLVQFDRGLWQGLYFSVPLLSILLAHEFGHYLECRRRRVNASLPFFLPSPLMFGTFGAFIRIRSPIYSREALFDIGIRGPLAGFAVLLPFLIAGVVLSKTSPAQPGSSVVFGSPLILLFLEHVRFPGIAAGGQVLLHPFTMAAWVGLFATALNLLPIGQLDGGHILYALGSGYWHRRVGLLVVLALIAAGFLYWPWWLWAVVMFFFGRRHILIYDARPLSRERIWLAVLALVIFVISATIVPVHGF